MVFYGIYGIYGIYCSLFIVFMVCLVSLVLLQTGRGRRKGPLCRSAMIRQSEAYKRGRIKRGCPQKTDLQVGFKTGPRNMYR